jgi:hypothetical protein
MVCSKQTSGLRNLNSLKILTTQKKQQKNINNNINNQANKQKLEEMKKCLTYNPIFV